MLVVGAASGAADVAINTLAGRAEHATTKPVLTRSHGLFSVGVVIASLSTGALLGAGLSLLAAFIVVAAVMLTLAAAAHLASASLQISAASRGPRTSTSRIHRIKPTSPLLVVGLVAALAYAVENAHQSWGSVMLTDVFTASPQLAAAAPATFAATAALARLSLAPLSRSDAGRWWRGSHRRHRGPGHRPSVAVTLTGLVLAALGTATLFPTLLSHSLRGTDPTQHGRATSTVAATAYLGFLLGPAYVGLLAEQSDLRGALIGVAALALAFTAAAALIGSWAARRARTAR